MYNNLGPGLLESAYETALIIELEKEGLSVEKQVYLPIVYGGVTIPKAYRIDLLVEKKVIIELKVVQHVSDVCYKQLLTYLKMTGLKLGILVNFDTTNIASSIHRSVNGLQKDSDCVNVADASEDQRNHNVSAKSAKFEEL